MAPHKLTCGGLVFGHDSDLSEERLDEVFAHAQMFQRENHDGADLPAIHLKPFIVPGMRWSAESGNTCVNPILT